MVEFCAAGQELGGGLGEGAGPPLAWEVPPLKLCTLFWAVRGMHVALCISWGHLGSP